MTKKGETTHYELPDFIDNVERYSGNVLDYVLVNSWEISKELVEKYKIEEGKKPVKLKAEQNYMSRRFQIIEEDFVNESDVVRHDPIKLARVLIDICRRENT
jgi:2-phospho-L-lactate transferase/gluconeogenesis factor (CofD/UPF0052 family)